MLAASYILGVAGIPNPRSTPLAKAPQPTLPPQTTLFGSTGAASPLNTSPSSRLGDVTSTRLIDTSDWNTYRNLEYRFSLQYPPNWGQPVVTAGNRQDEGTISCMNNPAQGPLSLQDANSVPLYDIAVTFTHKPTFRLTALTFTALRPTVALCTTENDVINLALDRDNLMKLPLDDDVIVNTNGVKMNRYPGYVFIDEGGGDTPWEPVYVRELYRFYGGSNLRIEALMADRIDSDRLTQSGCIVKPESTREDCAASWFEQSAAAADIRSSFESFTTLMQSFGFSL